MIALPFAWSCLVAAVVSAPTARPTVYADQPNTLDFPPRPARFVRLVIHRSSQAEPCIDELEVYGPRDETNLALGARGAKAAASSCLPGYAIHRIEHLNDGRYGNARSWIAAAEQAPWAQIELPEPAQVARVVFSRDREGQYADRVPASYRTLIEQGWVHYFDYTWGREHDKAAPRSFGTLQSRLWKLLDGGHYDARLSREDQRRVKCWIDLNCPLWPDYQFRPERPGPDHAE